MRRHLLISTISIGLAWAFALAVAGPMITEWLFAGGRLKNTSSQDDETIISPASVVDLQVKWQNELDGSISATASVADGAVYVPDWGGSLHRLDAMTGEKVWTTKIADYTGIPNDFARVTPAVDDEVLIIGNQAGRNNRDRDPELGGAMVIAMRKDNGEQVWATKVEDHPRAIITASPVIHAGVVYVGVASFEEDVVDTCCDFRGSVVALDVATGAMLWKTYTAPEGYSGNAVWSSAPVVDVQNGLLYFTTGNNYLIPEEVLSCINTAITTFDPDDFTLVERDAAIAAVQGCYGTDFELNWFNAVVALELETGATVWATHTLPFDAWTGACFAPEPLPSCQGGPDYDFAQGPMLFKRSGPEGAVDLLAVGQKSGDFWGLDPITGDLIWKTKVGPGSVFAGGLQWGSATDGTRIYTGANLAVDEFFQPKPWTLQGGGNNGETIFYGFWSALDAGTGEILWQVADLNMSGDIGRMAVANGVVFAGSLGTPQAGGGAANDPTMVALHAETGEVLWDFVSGGSVISGAAIVNGMVYWGSGYAQFGSGTENTTFYAFGF